LRKLKLFNDLLVVGIEIGLTFFYGSFEDRLLEGSSHMFFVEEVDFLL
jgi:hypothetical protein